MSDQEFSGRVAIVTGAASGIGRAVAERFAIQGAAVALLDCDEEHGQAAAENIRAVGGVCEFYVTDVASEPNIISTVQAILGRFRKIDHLVNNAGIVLVKGVEQCTIEEWDRVMDINVRSIFLTVKHTLQALRSSSDATVVNVGSISGLVAQKGTPAYVASKGAVLMLSKALALDLAEYGIRVNCVCPGITDTAMFRFHVNTSRDPERTLEERCQRVPMGRMLSPNEIADAVSIQQPGFGYHRDGTCCRCGLHSDCGMVSGLTRPKDEENTEREIAFQILVSDFIFLDAVSSPDVYFMKLRRHFARLFRRLILRRMQCIAGHCSSLADFLPLLFPLFPSKMKRAS